MKMLSITLLGLLILFSNSASAQLVGKGDYDASGLRTGEWYYYAPNNGGYVVNGFYVNGKKEGDWVFYHWANSSDWPVEWVEELCACKIKSEYYEYKVTIEYVNGLKHGSHEASADGKKEETGQYKNDEKTGEWKSYYTRIYNTLREVKNYANDKLNGVYRKYESYGGEIKTPFLFSETEYVNDQRHGFYKQYNKRSHYLQPELVGSYFNDKKHGEWKTIWYKSDTAVVTKKITYAHGIIEGEQIEMITPDGDYSSETKEEDIEFVYTYIKDGKEDLAERKSLYYSGAIKSEISPDYILTVYHETGEKKSKVQLDTLGNKSGEYKSYYANGRLWTSGYYLEGEIPDGEWKSFYNNGQLGYHYLFENGKQIGESLLYYKDGTLKEKAFYVDGKRHGAYSYFHKNGRIRDEYYYVNGVMDGIQMRYHANGKKSVKYVYKEGNKTRTRNY